MPPLQARPDGLIEPIEKTLQLILSHAKGHVKGFPEHFWQKIIHRFVSIVTSAER